MSSKRLYKTNLIIRIAGLFVLIIVIFKFNWNESISILKKAALLPIAVAAFLNLFRLFIEALRWRYLIYMQGVSYSVKDSFLALLSSSYIGMVTPGRIGNFLRVFYLAEDTKVSVGFSLSNVVIDKLIELIVLLALGIWGLTMIHKGATAFMLAGMAILLLSFLFFVIGYKRFHVVIEKILLKTVRLKKFTKNIDENRSDFYNGLRYFYKKPAIIVPILITFFSFFCLFLQAYFVLSSIGLKLPFWDVCKSVSISRMVARLVPISFLGWGSKDVSTIMIFKNLGASIEQGVSFSLLFLFTSYVVSAISGAISWIIKPIKIVR